MIEGGDEPFHHRRELITLVGLEVGEDVAEGDAAALGDRPVAVVAGFRRLDEHDPPIVGAVAPARHVAGHETLHGSRRRRRVDTEGRGEIAHAPFVALHEQVERVDVAELESATFGAVHVLPDGRRRGPAADLPPGKTDALGAGELDGVVQIYAADRQLFVRSCALARWHGLCTVQVMAPEPNTEVTQANVRTEVRGSTLIVTIDRPAVRNAVDGPTATALADAFEAFDGDDALAVAILTGAGDTFCAGADLKAVAGGRGNRLVVDPAERGPMGPTRMQLAKPVIAAVEGFAVAGGLELALWCDLRVAATDATFGVYCRRWGVPLVDGGTVRLPRLIGQSRALDLILTGRGVSGEEAVAMGLVNRLTDPGRALDGAVELAGQLAAFPQLCLRSDRRSVYDQWSVSEMDALMHESRLGLETIQSGETQEGAARFASGEGRHGRFDG